MMCSDNCEHCTGELNSDFGRDYFTTVEYEKKRKIPGLIWSGVIAECFKHGGKIAIIMRRLFFSDEIYL